MPSIALLVHLADVVTGLAPTGPVTLAAAEMAISWCELLEAHARRIYGEAIERRSPAHLLSEKILVGDIESPFSIRQVTRHHWSGLKGTDGVERAVHELEAAHWVRRIEEGSGGQKKTLFHINPKVFEQ